MVAELADKMEVAIRSAEKLAVKFQRGTAITKCSVCLKRVYLKAQTKYAH